MNNIKIKRDKLADADLFNIEFLGAFIGQLDVYQEACKTSGLEPDLSHVANLIMPFYAIVIEITLKESLKNGLSLLGEDGVTRYVGRAKKVAIVFNHATRAMGILIAVHSPEIDRALSTGALTQKNEAVCINVVYAMLEGDDNQFDTYDAIPIERWEFNETINTGGVLVC